MAAKDKVTPKYRLTQRLTEFICFNSHSQLSHRAATTKIVFDSHRI